MPQIALGADSTYFAGSVGASLVVDFTFIDQIFVGIGGGGGLVQYGDDKIRRKGLMLAADVRLHFVSGSVLVSPIATIGYEAF